MHALWRGVAYIARRQTNERLSTECAEVHRCHSVSKKFICDPVHVYALCINTIILGPCTQRFAQEVAPAVGNHRGERLYNHSGNHSCSLVQCDLIQINVWEWVPGLERKAFLHEGVCICRYGHVE